MNKLKKGGGEMRRIVLLVGLVWLVLLVGLVETW